jgi:phosphotransferase system  glucose/maltose/N-acetylglucosamine-specific IIC component
MKPILWLRNLARAGLLSPRWFVGRALLMGVFFLICQAFHLREYTTFLSGTPASAGTGMNLCAVLGLVYIVSYFGLILAAPIFLIAAFLLKVQQWLFPSLATTSAAGTPETETTL